MQNRTPIAKEARPPLPEFTPVPRKYRHDGWTPERQKAFISALAEASWMSAGADVPEVYREWIAAAEAEGRPVPVVPLTPQVDDGIAAVRKAPSWRQARKAKAAREAEAEGEGEAA